MLAGRATTTTPHGARSLDATALLVGAGGVVLFVSLFLEWFQPGADAWNVFEVWDLVLALLAVAAVVSTAGRLGYGPARPPSWTLVPAIGALVIVLHALLDPPPVATGLPDGDPAIGLWLALAASALMAAGAVLSVARISVAISTAAPPAAAPVARRHDPAAPVAPAPGDPVAPAPGDPVAAPGDPHRGRSPHLRDEVPATADPVPPATEPTRRL